MGANCCVAAKEKTLPNTARTEVSAYRNIRHSPSWSFRCDNRTHIEDFMDNHTQSPHPNSENVGLESKSGATTESEGHPDGSPSNQAKKGKKSSITTVTSGKSEISGGDEISGSVSPLQEKDYGKSSCLASTSNTKHPVLVTSTPSSAALKAEPSSSGSHYLSCGQTSPWDSHHLPGYQLSGQISDSRITSLQPLNENSSPESRQSFVLSVCSNDTSGGSHGGSSDGWSMRTFTELVASSQRERWSFESENFISNHSKMRCNTQQLTPLSPDLRTCRICSKLLKEKSPWSAQKLMSTNELAVVAVLVCGHVCHAECLENMTPETEKYDPPCPICMHGEKSAAKIFGKVESKAKNKISRIAVADVDMDEDVFSDHQERTGKGPRMGASSSLKSSFGRPFLGRHFSVGWPSRSVSESETSRKRGFWSRYRRE